MEGGIKKREIERLIGCGAADDRFWEFWNEWRSNNMEKERWAGAAAQNE